MQKATDFPFLSAVAPAQEMFQEWISFFPVAPLFGVEWRFNFVEGMMANPWSFPVAKTAEPAAAEPVAEVAIEPVAEAVAVPVADVAEAAQPEPVVADAASVIADDRLERIKGIGPKLAEELAEMGITSLAQVAALTSKDLARIDAALTTIKGRCYRDDWVGQAKALIG